MRFCSVCGSEDLSYIIPEGDDRERHYCNNCKTVHYVNPKVVTGCLLTSGDKILLCKRAIEPRKGFWTFPSGFMENGETAEQGALREAYEESFAQGEVSGMHLLYSLPHINQVYLIFLGTLKNPESIAPGTESLEVGLFTKSEIPYKEIAFSAVEVALDHYFQDQKLGRALTHIGSFQS